MICKPPLFNGLIKERTLIKIYSSNFERIFKIWIGTFRI
ncbi:unnamed protein product [Paramecium sonneborni]|uniref:Uncharacterized protein n=1 Tax=Paramecium sonneborni TaxID=65129 RepID=A0A8S1NLD6_9CILI|nr:unnamed protein product [Paramecium sonneborni]